MAGALLAVDWSSALAAAKPGPIAVEVPRHPRVSGSLTISFRPREPLPSGGYYYAVVVLTKRYAKRLALARCARESDMADTEYGYPDGLHKLNLSLGPETSVPAEGQPPRMDWCAGAAYKGAIYAVPHAPPCLRSEPCYGHTTAPECYAGETWCEEGKFRPKGKLKMYRRKPGELPTPKDSATHVIAHFRVHFARR
jgi:hypothetical protein